MKKSLLIAAAVMITFGACTNDDSAPVQNEISFKAINYKNTRAAINISAYPTDIPFGVFAYYLPTGKNWSSNYADAQLYMNNIKVSFESDIYKPVTKYYWPNTGSLTFVAYSPKEVLNEATLDNLEDKKEVEASYATATKTLTIANYSCETVEGGDFSDQSDLMYSKAVDADDISANDKEFVVGSDVKGVQIQFRHALSQIRFFAKSKEESSTTQFNVLKIELQNIENKGTLKVVNDAITGDNCGWTITPGTKASFVTYNDDNGVALPMDASKSDQIGGVDNNLLVIPQIFHIDAGEDPEFNSDCEIVVTYRMWVNETIDAGIKTKSVKLSDIIEKFEPNKIYNMNFSISADEILFAPEIESWDVPVESLNGDLEEQN